MKVLCVHHAVMRSRTMMGVGWRGWVFYACTQTTNDEGDCLRATLRIFLCLASIRPPSGMWCSRQLRDQEGVLWCVEALGRLWVASKSGVLREEVGMGGEGVSRGESLWQ